MPKAPLRLDPIHIYSQYPQGCYVYDFSWDTSHQRCSRNLLPMFVKPIVYEVNGRKSYRLFKHHPVTHVCQKELNPYASMFVTETAQEAIDGYKSLIDMYSQSRLDYVESTITSSKEYIKSLNERLAKNKLV